VLHAWAGALRGDVRASVLHAWERVLRKAVKTALRPVFGEHRLQRDNRLGTQI
jgi:hypothetical protein